MNEDIEKIFQGKITINKKNIPVVFKKYSGHATDYVVWFNDGNVPGFNADDKIIYTINSVEFNIYTKGNYIDIVQKLKDILETNDYFWTGDNEDLYEEDTQYHHFVMTFEKIRRK